ncbi:MAG: hypothetical protein AB9835_12230 [Eubacteriales bacterium]
MRSTGQIRRVDELGRVMIPKEVRRSLCINEGTPLAINVDDEDNLVFSRYSPLDKYEECIAQLRQAVGDNLPENKQQVLEKLKEIEELLKE